MDTMEVLGQVYRPRVIDAGLRRAQGAAGAETRSVNVGW
jgi:hypothetical protein